ncbi:MAG TPA: nuclear transport factor 2 family protein [Steroidobacteraceae bacterium]|nr:nuclear transport factor 2 family protein [Steroidobacteraceae bacterium]
MNRPHMLAGCARVRLLLLLSISLALCGCRPATESNPPLARKQSWEILFNRGDSAAVADLYSQNAELVMSGAAPIHGRQAIHTAIAKMAKSGAKVSVEVDRSAAAGDFAYFYGPYTVFLQQKVIERGTYLEVWHRYSGHWLLDLDVNASSAQ